MAYVIAAPEMMASAATDLAAIGSDLSDAHTAAAQAMQGLAPAAGDEVSVGIAHLFSQHARDYQALAGKAAAFQDQFGQNLKTSGGVYAAIEDFLAQELRQKQAFFADWRDNGAKKFAQGEWAFPIEAIYFLVVGPLLILGLIGFFAIAFVLNALNELLSA